MEIKSKEAKLPEKQTPIKPDRDMVQAANRIIAESGHAPVIQISGTVYAKLLGLDLSSGRMRYQFYTTMY